ncbi:MAG: EamA family transporter [Planctomycetales bacterium]|nr:EamA family transporter [Planctomycetales bacterium]
MSNVQVSKRSLLVGRWLIVAAAVLWSTSGFFAKAPWFAAWPLDARGPLMAFWRTLFAGLCLVPWVRRPRWTWWLVPATLSFALMSITYLCAITRTTAANAIWLQSTAPLWVFLMGITILREKVRRADWLMLVAVAAGVGFIITCEVRSSTSTPEQLTGVLLALTSGVLYALVVVFVRALRDLDSAWLISLNLLVTAVVLLPYVLYRGLGASQTQVLWLSAFGVFQMGLPYLLFARGLRVIPGHEASFICLLEPVLVPIWVWLSWRHHPSYQPPAWWTYVGGGLILIGLFARFSMLTPEVNGDATSPAPPTSK